MPTIYQARCKICSFRSELFTEGYGAVFVDTPSSNAPTSVVAGAVLNESVSGARFAEQADPRLVVLAHPIEASILAGIGYTWTRLAWKAATFL